MCYVPEQVGQPQKTEVMENSRIEWTDHTFNPWIGCAKVSAGCKNCYAETLMDTRYGRVVWGVNGTRSRTGPDNWRKPIQWNKQAQKEGLRFRVFCASLADVFEDRPELVEWRTDLFKLIDATPHLDWLLLTKRPENIERMWREVKDRGWLDDPRQNVWLGTSVEDQAAADLRIPALLKAAHLARFAFLSCEPLLGPVDLQLEGRNLGILARNERVSWVIVGGESGPVARAMHPEWARSIRDQCYIAKVPVLFKQWGEYMTQAAIGEGGANMVGKITPAWMREDGLIADGQTPFSTDVPANGATEAEHTWVKCARIGKHAAGRLLDGVLHNGFPL